MTTEITVLDLEAYSGLTLEQLGEQALAKIGTPDISERWLRKTFALPADVPLEPAFRQAVAARIERYRATLPEKRRAFGAQTDDCVRIAVERKYVDATPGFTLVITDDLLHRGLPSDLRCWTPPNHFGVYSAERNTVFVSHALPNLVVAHEAGHALSRHRKKADCDLHTGFRRHKLNPDGKTYLVWENKWLDEGVTVLWEELSVNDGSTLPEGYDEENIYSWYREAVRALMEALNLDQDTMFRAYFGNEAAYALMEARVRQRFNCTLDDLDHIALYTEIDFTRKLLRGEPVQYQLERSKVRVRQKEKLIAERPHTELNAQWHVLAKIFPNLTLIELKA